MTAELALELHLVSPLWEKGFGQALSGAEQATIRKHVKGDDERLLRGLRIVPDGIGRLPARIDAKLLRTVVEALRRSRKLRVSYRRPDAHAEEARELSPLGLVAKDGTIYLVAVTGLADTPRHYALHRMGSAEDAGSSAQPRPEFDLDRHIASTHQFSHALDGNTGSVELVLRVTPETIHHFEERPLSATQTVEQVPDDSGWYLVRDTVPMTMQLVPFLLSMGAGLEVVSPSELRCETIRRLSKSLSLYWVTDRGAATG
jgi:predicted DNA-binding transcriptional regulator YafY